MPRSPSADDRQVEHRYEDEHPADGRERAKDGRAREESLLLEEVVHHANPAVAMADSGTGQPRLVCVQPLKVIMSGAAVWAGHAAWISSTHLAACGFWLGLCDPVSFRCRPVYAP